MLGCAKHFLTQFFPTMIGFTATSLFHNQIFDLKLYRKESHSDKIRVCIFATLILMEKKEGTTFHKPDGTPEQLT